MAYKRFPIRPAHPERNCCCDRYRPDAMLCGNVDAPSTRSSCSAKTERRLRRRCR